MWPLGSWAATIAWWSSRIEALASARLCGPQYAAPTCTTRWDFYHRNFSNGRACADCPLGARSTNRDIAMLDYIVSDAVNSGSVERARGPSLPAALPPCGPSFLREARCPRSAPRGQAVRCAGARRCRPQDWSPTDEGELVARGTKKEKG